MSQKFITLLLALLLGIQPVATDLYLSALPSLQVDLSATIAQSQLTLSTMLLTFGVSQLFLGSLSDRVGRRPIMLWGLALFTLSAALMTMTHHIAGLIVLRALQGIGLGAAVMSGRAVLRDLFEPEQGAMVMSKAFTGLGLIALACALIGSTLTQYLGWRFTLLGMGVYGAGLWLLLWLRFRETLTAPNPNALHLQTLIRNWRTILAHPGFLSYSMLCTLSFCGLVTFLGGSPFVLITMLGLSKLQFGFCLFLMPLFYITGTLYCRHLLRRHGLQRAVKQATWLIFFPGLALGAFAAFGVYQLWAILLPFYLFVLGHGVMQSSGQAGSVAHFPHMAGTASALNGFFMMAFAFCITLWIGSHLSNNPGAMMFGIAFCCILLSFVAWVVVPKYGKLPA